MNGLIQLFLPYSLFLLANCPRCRAAERPLPPAEYIPFPGGVTTLPKLPTHDASDGHCEKVHDNWCGQYYDQIPVAWRPPPRGSTACPNDCSNVGSCDYDRGVCACPTGWSGADCSIEARSRPCDNMAQDGRDKHYWNSTRGPDGSDMTSRCAGMCDDHIGFCFCPPGTRHGQVPASTLAPQGAPPRRHGRPMHMCQPKELPDGNPTGWANASFSYDALFGKNGGWCQDDLPHHRCPCVLDGLAGGLCNIHVEQYCPNQCSARGSCHLGFCKCNPGWYPGGGGDCSRKLAMTQIEPDDVDAGVRAWVDNVMTPVAAVGGSEAESIGTPSAKRLRPLVFVYALPPELSSNLLQWRLHAGRCTYRLFGLANISKFVPDGPYASEPVLHELFLSSRHRTFDPAEADFFFVPALTACVMQMAGRNDTPRFPTAAAQGTRPMHAASYMTQVQEWIARKHPYFNRSGGRDHIWHLAHDEGACYVPKVIWPGVMLSHWGRTDFPHTSRSLSDNYSVEVPPSTGEGGFLETTSRTHACFDKDKDLVLPAFLEPAMYHQSPYLGHRTKRRDVFLFFRGKMRSAGDLACLYSKCTRQRLLVKYLKNAWRKRFNALIGDVADIPGDDADLLSRSLFCLVLQGDGAFASLSLAVLHGCIPVIVMDDVVMPFEQLIKYSEFAVRIDESNLEWIPDILRQQTPAVVQRLQEGLHDVWHRFRFAGLTLTQSSLRQLYESNRDEAGGSAAPQPPGSQWATSELDDAFSTLLQWLYVRIPAAHQGRQPS